MEIEKERNIHYLHPDFEEDNENKEKKPSPLALLAQTCQSIGSGKECKLIPNRDKSCSPNSTSTGTRRSFKRSNSDYLSNSSDSPSIDRVGSPPLKKSKPNSAGIDLKYGSRVELTHADTSSDILGKELNQSLMNGFMNFLKNSNNSSQQSYTDKLEFLYFLTNRFMNPEKPKDISNFNISNGYHLKNQIIESNDKATSTAATTAAAAAVAAATATAANSSGSGEPNCYAKVGSLIEPTPKSVSTIKYCMYCGKLIPLLPMLLAHIRFDHANDQCADLQLQNLHAQMPSLCDFLMKFNPYNLSGQDKVNQPSPAVPALTNYINNWSSLLGYENMIF